jgi:hypothetical protein
MVRDHRLHEAHVVHGEAIVGDPRRFLGLSTTLG